MDFNLISEPWIPCLQRDGTRLDLGIRDVLFRANEIGEIDDPSPVVTLALHRLLLAVLHRNFGPPSAAAWGKIWKLRAWDVNMLSAYWENWRERFNLFDAQHPFYQVADLDFQYEVPISKLAHELASGNNATLFDHSIDEAVRPVSAAEATRWLVAHQCFAAGGLVSLEKGCDPRLYKSADAAPLTRGAVILVKGNTLFETLMLNLHRYDPKDEVPFKSNDNDCPAWERDQPTEAGDREVDGCLDLLTWQSRRIRLHPELTPSGKIAVRATVIMKGFQFRPGFHLHTKETMLAFTRNAKAAGDQDPWPPVSFHEGRALWRDSTALFQAANEDRSRPENLQWIDDLALDGYLDARLVLPVDVLGLRTDRAKVLFWRHERLPLPLEYLHNSALIAVLKSALTDAEDAAKALRDALRKLAELLLAPQSDESAGRRANKNDVRTLVESLGIERSFWPVLESHFKQLLTALPHDQTSNDIESGYGECEIPKWRRSVWRAATDAFDRARDTLAPNLRSHKAVAKAEVSFYSKRKAAFGMLEMLEPPEVR